MQASHATYTPSTDMQQLIDIVRSAAQYMHNTQFEVSQKDGFANIVTSSDVAVQQFLCQQLAQLIPGSGFLCEEEDIWDTTHEYTWVIDPIDGTANYARGIDQCAICVGLWHHGTIIRSVVYLPRTDELFHAEKGCGAYRNGIRIHTSERTFQNAVMCTALAVYHKEYADVCSRIIVDTFSQCNDIRRFGAAAPELCYLAMGRCELYFEYLLSPWDFAAASLILTEAGGCLSDLHGNPLSCLSASGVLAANNTENLTRLQSIACKHLPHECAKSSVTDTSASQDSARALRIGVFCSSSDKMEPTYYAQAAELAQWMASQGHTLVYGGCRSGLMEAMAQACHQHGGHVIGVVPQVLIDAGRVSTHIDEMVVTQDLGDRKQGIIDHSDIIVALPGSVGTLDEIFTVLAASSIGIQHRQVILWNMMGFWDDLFHMLQGLEGKNVVNKPLGDSILRADTLQELEEMLNQEQEKRRM